MASKPGILTDWPWTPLGNFKYSILAPWAIHATYQFIFKPSERDLGYFLAFPYLLTRILHNQIWITLSRYQTAKGKNRIVDKGIEFEQVDRERNWDDQIIFNGLLFYLVLMLIPEASHLPLWRTNGVILTMLLHVGPVEFVYYWLHRGLHHHFLYSRYHSHHHSSIVTEPISSVIHPFAEHIAYFALFATPLLTTILTGTASIASSAGYIFFIDFMNNMGHCNFEFIPEWAFKIFPPLKYLMYTPSFHSLHHTQLRTNYSLFMPLYDYIYETTDKSSDSTYASALKRAEEAADVVHLTHLTTPDSVYHLRLGFASLASRPHTPKWYLRITWPFTFVSTLLTWVFGRPIILESNHFKNLKLQSWILPIYQLQVNRMYEEKYDPLKYLMPWRREAINSLIEEATLEADRRGVKVLSLGLLNQGEELNRNGEIYTEKYKHLKLKIVDGSGLAVAVVVNSIPKGTAQVILRGTLNKVAFGVARALCQRGIQIAAVRKDEFEKLKVSLDSKYEGNLILSNNYNHKVWLVGDDLSEEEQSKAPTGAIFIPYSQFPPTQLRKDCCYHSTPAMIIPPSFKNMHSCENWLPRMVMSAWRIGGIVHALEGWDEDECGNTILEGNKVWEASLRHGFRPMMLLPVPSM